MKFYLESDIILYKITIFYKIGLMNSSGITQFYLGMEIVVECMWYKTANR